MSLNPNICAICAHDIHSPACPHPWRQPFDLWPPMLRNQLKRLVPNGYDPDPPHDEDH